MADWRDGDDFGDRMKAYEAAETSRRLDPLLPIYARIDGRAFSNFTRGMQRPFDQRMTDAMIETTKHLVHQTHARIGYCQSDEISMIWLADEIGSDIFFSAKVQKMGDMGVCVPKGVKKRTAGVSLGGQMLSISVALIMSGERGSVLLRTPPAQTASGYRD